MSRTPSRRLLGIQFCRGIAATVVVLYHGGRMLALPQYIGHIALGGLFNFGNLGVDFFFVLSGFIIFFVHGDDIGQPQRLGGYLWSRLTRIYPPYWFATAIVIAMLVAKRDTPSFGLGHLMTSILLLPQPQDPILQVGWTLIHEMLFYVAFALAVLSHHLARLVAVTWLLLIACAFVFPSSNPLVGTIASLYNLQFAMGVGAAYAVKRWRPDFSVWFAGVGAVLFLGMAYGLDSHTVDYQSAFSRCALGLASASVIIGIARLESEGKLKVGTAPAFLGSASYSIYLVHTIVIGLFAKMLLPLHLLTAEPTIAFLLVSTLAIAAGSLVYLAVEKPILRLAKVHAPQRAILG